MRGVLNSLTKRVVSALIVLALTFSGVLLPLSRAEAAPGLDLARDVIGVLSPEYPNVYHEIYFVLPVDAQQVLPTDWVTITLPNYTVLSITSTFIVGGFNVPSISLSGKTVRITGIALLPGGSLAINGITATNPVHGDTNQVVVSISNNNQGTNPRNTATILPTTSSNQVAATATIQSPLSALSISGYTSPNAFTTLTSGLAVLSTTVADASGYFLFTLTGLSPGNYTYLIFSSDQEGRGTSQNSLSLSLLPNYLTTVTGLLLSPTISLSASAIDPGTPLVISGRAKPNSQINIFLEAPLRSYVATTNGSGQWSYTVPGTETANWTPGQYQVYAVVQDSNGGQSPVSPTVAFTVNTPNTGNPPPSCDISHGDLNCNGVTNLVDFSILLFHWNTNHRVADINKDGIVNLTDFSIMMFYFTN